MTTRADAEPLSKGLLTPVREVPGAAAPVTIVRRAPAGRAAVFVRHYWLPRWDLRLSDPVRQDVLEYPTANLVVEAGATAALHRAHRGMSSRVLEDRGWAFGVLLNSGVARGWTGVTVRSLPWILPLERLVVPDTDVMRERVGDRMQADDDTGAVEAFESWLDGLPEPDDDARLVDRIVAAVEADRELLRVEQLADRFDLGVRHLQRLVAGHIGFGPKWLIQRYRLQEAAAVLRAAEAPPLAQLAADLGYADQAHFSREFRAVTGSTPGVYAAAGRSR